MILSRMAPIKRISSTCEIKIQTMINDTTPLKIANVPELFINLYV